MLKLAKHFAVGHTLTIYSAAEASLMSPFFRLKTACKVNPFDESIPKSKTFQNFPSRRAAAPGHGFPLIKRKVREAAVELDSGPGSE